MDQLMVFIQEQLANNELFKGGLILGAGAALLTYLRKLPYILWTFCIWFFTVEIDIPDNEEAFKWLNVWLSRHKYSQEYARRLTVRTQCTDADSAGPKQWATEMSPAPGRHFIFEGKRLIILTRSREKLENATGGKAFVESFSLRVLGRSRKPALELIKKAQTLAAPLHRCIDIYESRDDGYWDNIGFKLPREVQSVILPDKLVDNVISDIDEFLISETWYRDRGIPYRRGYLLYGPPGTGKTSLIMAIASQLDWDISILNLSDVSDESSLTSAMNNIRDRSIVVVEDIDCLFDERQSSIDISLSGLLNAIDGLASHEGHMLFLTTNHRDRLDSALIRPGRVDMEVEFRSATPKQAVALFRRFFPEAGDAVSEQVAKRLPRNVSMAALQGHFIVHKRDFHAAIERLFSLGTPNESTTEEGRTSEILRLQAEKTGRQN